MKKILSTLLVVSITASLCVGCGSSFVPGADSASDSAISPNTNTSTTEKTGTHVVVDHAGNEVEVPDNITRVVIDQIPILSTYMAYFEGDAPHIVGFCGSFKSTISETVLKNIAPELMESSDTVYAQSDLNIEEIMKLEPDVIFYNAGNTEHAEILRASGIPSVGFSTTGNECDPLVLYQSWLTLLEDVFGESGKMDEFKAAGNAIVADVEARIAKIPENDRPSALIIWKYNDGVPQLSGQGTFGYFWMRRLGVVDMADETTGWAQVSVEQILEWDPDILFLDGPGLLPLRTSDVLENKVDGADFSSMSAVRNNRVYGTTLGMWNWFTPNPDAPIVFAWLACNAYPESFADYPLKDTIRSYYQQWYGYDVSDAELAEMLVY